VKLANDTLFPSLSIPLPSPYSCHPNAPLRVVQDHRELPPSSPDRSICEEVPAERSRCGRRGPHRARPWTAVTRLCCPAIAYDPLLATGKLPGRPLFLSVAARACMRRRRRRLRAAHSRSWGLRGPCGHDGPCMRGPAAGPPLPFPFFPSPPGNTTWAGPISTPARPRDFPLVSFF
jgi:hypothetical protein